MLLGVKYCHTHPAQRCLASTEGAQNMYTHLRKGKDCIKTVINARCVPTAVLQAAARTRLLQSDLTRVAPSCTTYSHPPGAPFISQSQSDSPCRDRGEGTHPGTRGDILRNRVRTGAPDKGFPPPFADVAGVSLGRLQELPACV